MRSSGWAAGWGVDMMFAIASHHRWWLLVVCCMLALAGWGEETWQLTIVHTNDVHDALLPFDYYGDAAQLQPPRDNVGGFARRATAIAGIRRATAHPLVVVDCGDLFMRGPWSITGHGVPEIESMNLMGYDLFCIGNHDIRCSEGVEAQQLMLGLLQRSHFPWLAANLTVGNTGAPVPGVHPYIVRTFGNVRVGFLGLTTDCIRHCPQVQGWTIGDPLVAARYWAPIARQECDILIAVTHLGLDVDKRLAAEVPGIDAVIGGHSHNFLPTPMLVHAPDGHPVPIAQAGEQGVMLGQLDLTFTREHGWHLQTATGRLIVLDGTFTDDPAVKRLLTRYTD